MPYKLSAGKLSSDLFFYPDDKKTEESRVTTLMQLLWSWKERENQIFL